MSATHPAALQAHNLSLSTVMLGKGLLRSFNIDPEDAQRNADTPVAPVPTADSVALFDGDIKGLVHELIAIFRLHTPLPTLERESRPVMQVIDSNKRPQSFGIPKGSLPPLYHIRGCTGPISPDVSGFLVNTSAGAA